MDFKVKIIQKVYYLVQVDNYYNNQKPFEI